MKKTLFAFLMLCVPIVIGIAGLAWWVDGQIHAPARFVTAQTIVIPKGASGMTVARQLREAQVIKHDWLFYALLRWPLYADGRPTIKAGEYQIPARASLWQVFDLMRDGTIITHKITLPEGLTVKQAIALLMAEDKLTGAVDPIPPEGSLLPETYQFERNETRQAVIKRMQSAMRKTLDDLWATRADDLPFQTKEQAVTLASIVEKETSVATEHPRVAGVYTNRLQQGIPLQADPTVVYAVTDGLGHMKGKRLWGKYLATESPYNTYKHAGLPPGPIANPGKASLAAVLQPERNDFIYFVADGSGGHVFARTLDEHNRNVKKWYKIRKTDEAKDDTK